MNEGETLNAFRFRPGKLPAVAVAVTAGLVIVLSGCSDHREKREYAIPSSFCGVSVDRDELAPFMPSGRKVTVQKDVPDSLSSVCRVRVDSRLAVEFKQMWLTSSSTAYFVGGQADSRLDREAEGGRFLYSGREAFGKTRHCTHEKLAGSNMFTAVQMQSSGHQDADAMRKLIAAYTKAVENTSICKDGKSFT
ncbi:hypothetical protein [Streptomyces sp. NRRL S-1022]|uniref:hypothetical protein n=1 Tax=Streptomyces sp. NRRL S-1022 TaxID=1463880 RepID=UPI00131ADB60|nr:hypothetical protein [Streptomyces sp. NRRL S-1022]